MFTNIPQLDMVIIDISEKEGKEKTQGGLSAVLKVGSLFKRDNSITADRAEEFLGEEKEPLKRLVDGKRVNVIQSDTELQQYKNAQGNDWITDQKLFKKKQYYIRHPKKNKRNLLIEANSFCEYIEDEQKEELIDFIFSHCRVRSILIEQIERDDASLGAESKVKGLDLKGSVAYGSGKEDYYKFTSPKWLRKRAPQKEYLWLDEWVKDSICSLKKGARFEHVYVTDFTFGLEAGEAKTVGLNMKKHNEQCYRLVIEC